MEPMVTEEMTAPTGSTVNENLVQAFLVDALKEILPEVQRQVNTRRGIDLFLGRVHVGTGGRFSSELTDPQVIDFYIGEDRFRVIPTPELPEGEFLVS